MDNKLYQYSNWGIDKLIEQIQQSIKPVVDFINSEEYKRTIEFTVKLSTEKSRIIQQYLRSTDVVENTIRPLLNLYTGNAQYIYETFFNMTKYDWNKTLCAYRDIINEIDINNLRINNNGTIQYEGNCYTKDEIENVSSDMAEEYNSKGKITTDTVIKKLLFCVVCALLISFLQTEDLKYLFLLMFGGFVAQPGADAYNFFKNKLKNTFNKDLVTNEYFENYSGLVQIDNLKLKKKPNKDAKIIATLQFGSSVEIKNQLGSWLEINYCVDEENNTYISGWVYANGIKRIKNIKRKLLEV